MLINYNEVAAWQSESLNEDRSWVYHLNDPTSNKLAENVKKVFDSNRALFEYSMDEFDFGQAIDIIKQAVQTAHVGTGLALLKGLPRDQLNEKEFRLLIWGIGLHLGVPRPQGKATQYISEVRNTGMNYRSAAGRGYNSNASLDFHCDGCDLALLACYNTAKSGGQSIISSSVSAWRVLQTERPDLAEIALQDFFFSRNNEEAEDEEPFYPQPLFDSEDGNIFGKWNRNRVKNAQQLTGVPLLTAEQIECTDFFDQILRRPELMYTMWLEPGDLQIINNHVLLHSRTAFEDYAEPERKRLLYRLWIAPPNSIRLPNSWKYFFRSVEPGSVRGGIRGHGYNSDCKTFDVSQAKRMGMLIPDL